MSAAPSLQERAVPWWELYEQVRVSTTLVPWDHSFSTLYWNQIAEDSCRHIQAHDDIFRGTKSSCGTIYSLLWHFCAAFNTWTQIISGANRAIPSPDITFLINLHPGALSQQYPHQMCFPSRCGEGCLELHLSAGCKRRQAENQI